MSHDPPARRAERLQSLEYPRPYDCTDADGMADPVRPPPCRIRPENRTPWRHPPDKIAWALPPHPFRTHESHRGWRNAMSVDLVIEAHHLENGPHRFDLARNKPLIVSQHIEVRPSGCAGPIRAPQKHLPSLPEQSSCPAGRRSPSQPPPPNRTPLIAALARRHHRRDILHRLRAASRTPPRRCELPPR